MKSEFRIPNASAVAVGEGFPRAYGGHGFQNALWNSSFGFRISDFRWFAALCLLLAGLPVRAQIGISGVTDKTVYVDQVTFTITNTAGFAYDARLEGRPVPVGAPVLLTRTGYQELSVFATNTVTSAVTSRLVRFIVRTAERSSTEDGLPPWTPYPTIPSAPGEFAGAALRLLAPESFPTGLEIPVVAWVENATGHAVRVSGQVAALGQTSFKLFRGVGSGFLSATNPAGVLLYSPFIAGLTTNKSITLESTTNWTNVSGTVSGNVTWPAGARMSVTNTLTIPAGSTLTIGEGAIVRLGARVNIQLDGALVINGTLDHPVVFTPAARTQPWGGFLLEKNTSQLTATAAIFTGSGAEPSWFGANGRPGSHRTEQALFYCTNAPSVTLTDCAAIALAGQFGHAVNGGQFQLTRFLMQRCTSGGEFTGSSWTVNDSAFIECPDDSADFVDGDNDALYFVSGTHGFTNTLIGWTKDDGVDSGGSGAGLLNFQNCWFESTFHEGNSLSGTGKNVTHRDDVFINCGQALESGYDGPNGVMLHCLATGNLIGGRFGDNYNWTYGGTLRATNSLLLYNLRDVWGMNWADWTYRSNQMDIRSNYLSAPDPRWTSNALWNPATDGARLAEFLNLPADSAVGVGFALRTNRLTAVELTNGVPIRLSRFSTNAVSVSYSVESPDGILVSGSLTFYPGETVKNLALPIASPEAYELLSLRLGNPVNCELTGLAQAFTVAPPPPVGVTTLVSFNSTWRYLANGVDQGTAWMAPTFADGAWSSGAGKLGFNNGNTGFGTIISYGADANNKYRTTYFRKQFTVTSVDAFASLLLELYRDDGVVTYLNGVEVYRNNLANGVPVLYASFATNCSDNGTLLQSATLPVDALVSGTNVIAAEVHQSSANSSDLVFDLKLTGNPAVAVRLKQAALSNGLALYWDDPMYVLESATALSGPWLPDPDAGNPILIPPTTGQRFFRLKH